MSSDLDFRAKHVDVRAVPGDGFTFTVELADLGFLATPTAVATFGAVTATTSVAFNVTSKVVTITVTLSSAQTTTLDTTAAAWTLVVTPAGGSPRTFVGGTYQGDVTPTRSTPRAAHRVVPYDTIGTLTITGGATNNYVLSGSGSYGPGGADVAIVDGGTGASTAAEARTNLVAERKHWFNIVDYGAVGDGVTLNTTAIGLAIAAAAGGTVYVPQGTFLHDSITYTAGFRMAGDGPGSVLKASTTTSSMYLASGAGVSGLCFENLTIDQNSIASVGVRIDRVDGARFAYCDFRNLPKNSNAIYCSTGGWRIEIIGCRFYNPSGLPYGKACDLRGVHITRILGNTVEWLGEGFTLQGNATGCNEITISNNVVDMHWYTARPLQSGTATSFTSDSMTDTSATFDAAVLSTDANLHGETWINRIRVLIPAATGTLTSSGPTNASDTGAGFVAAGVRDGYLIRTSTAWAKVSDVFSTTALTVSNWYSLTPATWGTRVTPPSGGTAYTIYKVIIGSTVAVLSPTQVSCRRWNTLGGAAETPPNGSIYEILYVVSRGGGIGLYQGSSNATVTGNVVVESMRESIWVDCMHAEITGNITRDSHDAGISTNLGVTTDCNVVGNTIYHPGSAGIFAYANDSLISANTITDPWWVVEQTGGDQTGGTGGTSGINVKADGIDVINNRIEFTSKVTGYNHFGVTVQAVSSDVRVAGNRLQGWATAPVNVETGATNVTVDLGGRTVELGGMAGDVGLTANPARWYNDTGSIVNLSNLRASVGTPPVGAPITVSVRLNGVESTTLSVPDGSATSSIVVGPIVVPNGGVIECAVTNIGETVTGADLSITGLAN